MSKRCSSFERAPRDFYPTPIEAVHALFPHLKPGTRYVEPAAGDGALMDILTNAGHSCYDAWDIEPRREDIWKLDATTHIVGSIWHDQFDCFITNPPWKREILHPMIINLSDQKPTWLLFDADWKHTGQAAPFMSRCRKIVSVGRVKWIPGSKMTGKDNAAWYLFDKPDFLNRAPEFYFPLPKAKKAKSRKVAA